MESYAQVSIADLPRAGGLTDGARGTHRPTTPVLSSSNPLTDPSFTALGHQMQRLEEALAALTREHEALDEDAAARCHEGLEVADSLLVASAQRGIKDTIWKLCHTSRYSKKCDMLRRHIGIAQHTYETVGKRCQDAVRPLTELCEWAKSLDDDAGLASGSINEANFRQGRKKPIVNFRIGSGLDAWSRMALTPAAVREDDQVTNERMETLQKMLQQAEVESLQQGSGATRKAEKLLVVNLIVRMEVFRAKRSKLSAELRGKETTLQVVGDRCRGIAARLDALQESNFGDLVFGVQDLASSIAVERYKKKKEEKYWETRKSARRSHTSITSRLAFW
ncbi:hypothetical protein LZ30DRAFT_590803 [Colletotrichum cereale]|nr:hypothetical protein LZ30DRAFT_590803 [Colletotrichum cereale]